MRIKKSSARLELLDVGHPVPRKQLKGMKVGDNVTVNVNGRKVIIGTVTAMYKKYDDELGFDECDVKMDMDKLENVPINALADMAIVLKNSKKRKGYVELSVGQKKAMGIVKKFDSKKWLSNQTVKMFVKKVENE